MVCAGPPVANAKLLFVLGDRAATGQMLARAPPPGRKAKPLTMLQGKATPLLPRWGWAARGQRLALAGTLAAMAMAVH